MGLLSNPSTKTIRMANREQIITITPPKPHSKKQALIMNAFNTPGLKRLYVACGTKFGKACHIDTLVPTPDRGYIQMQDIKAGDYVFNEHGKPTKVVYATDVMLNHDCYEVTFIDGTKVIADAEHDWITTTAQERKNIARALSPNDRCKSTTAKPTKRNTKELFDTQHTYEGGKKRSNHAIDNVSGPLEFKGCKLPIQPYTLGLWLGDRAQGAGQITNPDYELIKHVEADGYEVREVNHADSSKCRVWTVRGLIKDLKNINMGSSKFVPPEYLTASVEDRMALLQGLMDSDGTIDKRGNSRFDNTNKSIADGVAILAASLGIKVHRAQRIGRLNGEDKKLCYRVWFTTDKPVFRLKRKLARLGPVNTKSNMRTIVSVEKVPSVPVMCIHVDNPSHLFLITESCIPTHNSISASVCEATAAMKRPNTRWRWIAPIYEQARIGMDYFRPILPPDPHTKFRETKMRVTLPRINTEIQFWHTRDPISLEGGGIHGNIFDEAAKCDPAAIDSANTTVTFTDGPQMYISTPFGKNHFFNACMEAKQHMEWALRNGKLPDRAFITARTIDNPFIKPEVVLRAKQSMSDRLFRQYYLAEFIDDGSTFIGFRDCVRGMQLDIQGAIQFWKAGDAGEHEVIIGVDWAKKSDYTVMMALTIDEGKPRVVGVLRFTDLGYVDALKELYGFCRNFKSIRLIKHDKTGVGEAIDDMLAQMPFPYEGIIFTNKSKSAMVNQLMLTFETRDIILPNWVDMINELEMFEVKTSDSGNFRYSAPTGMHDDIVCALMIANSAVKEYTSDFKLRFMEDLPDDKLTLAKWYSDLKAESDDDSPF